MRIGLVSPYDLGRAGGVQDQVIRLAGWLEDAGHDPIIVGPGTEGPDGAILLGPTTTITANRAQTPIRLDPRVGRRLRAALGGIDVLHVHEPLMPTVSTAAMRIKGPAKVATFHADPTVWARSAIEGIVEYRIVPNGIDIADYSKGPKDPVRVAFLGRDDERKGLSVLLDAWPTVRASVPEARLVVMGADRGDAGNGVEYLGWVDETTKRSVLSTASVFCAPNLGGESFGITLAEAMASDCAIVASAIPAFEHVAGPTARFCTPGDAACLARELESVLTDRATAQRLGSDAGERVIQFDGATVAAQFVSAYEAAIEEHAGR